MPAVDPPGSVAAVLIEWSGDIEGVFWVDGVEYRCLTSLKQGNRAPGQLLVMKNPRVVRRYQELIEREQPRNILELGIYAGGSTALFAQLAAPDRLAALDFSPDPQPDLARFVDEHDLGEVVALHYGVDQADADALDRIVAGFDGALDLVIDDASHLEAQTRASFNRLFPHLRPGGCYVIEDWAWAHQIFPPSDPQYHGVTPMSLVVLECVLACARHPDLITEVVTDKQWALVRRGPADLPPGTFDLSARLDPIGRRMVEQAATVRSRAPRP
jgi:predicted O-methyltransferase YrrM